MKVARLTNLLFALCAFTVTSNAEDIRASDGTVYKDAQITAHTSVEVTIVHQAGVAHVPLASLSVSTQERFGYDPEKAAQYAAAVKQQNEQRADANAVVAAAQSAALRRSAAAANAAAQAETDKRVQQRADDEAVLVAQAAALRQGEEANAAAQAAAQAKLNDQRNRAEAAVNQQMAALEQSAARRDWQLTFATAQTEAVAAEMRGDNHHAELIRIRARYALRLEDAYRDGNSQLAQVLREGARMALRQCEATDIVRQERER